MELLYSTGRVDSSEYERWGREKIAEEDTKHQASGTWHQAFGTWEE